MDLHISLLRGINVGGHHKIPMSSLKQWYEELGFHDVKSYIQSGNLVFKSPLKKNTDVELLIKEKIRSMHNMNIEVIVRSAGEFEKALRNHPFAKLPQAKEEHLLIIFLQQHPDEKLSSVLNKEDYLPDQFQLVGREIFLYCPDGYGRTKLTSNFFERKWKVIATTRNLKTVKVLQSMTQPDL